MRVVCAHCGKGMEKELAKYQIKCGGKSIFFCDLNCLSESQPIKDVKHLSLSDLTLNKTVYEFFALLTGLGGVYFTIFEAGDNALIMDTVSVISAIVAMIIGIEHLRYVEEHKLVKKAIILIGLLMLTGLILFIWHYR